MDPMVGSMLKYACGVGTVEVKDRKDPSTHRMEEETVEVVRNREDGTRRRAGPLLPKGVGNEFARGRRPGVDSPTKDDGGASLDNPKRGTLLRKG